MIKKGLSVLLFVLSGCSTYEPGVRFMYVGENGHVHQADCDGRRFTMGDCYRLANETCFGKFEILHKSEKTFETTSYSEDDDGDEVVDVSTSIDRNLLFYCKN